MHPRISNTLKYIDYGIFRFYFACVVRHRAGGGSVCCGFLQSRVMGVLPQPLHHAHPSAGYSYL
nr:MAG TPA: hypothetical protein [Caudoviricetes sp.]